jgi:hypothetical protein
MLFREECIEESHVRRRCGDVHHALETDILVEPYGPAQTILGGYLLSI